MSEIRNLKLVIFCLLLAISYTLSASSVYSATFSKPPSNLGLVGYWSFDEGAGTVAHDFSGNGNHGTLTNMSATTDWVGGKRGKALDFDGTNDHITQTDSVSTSVTGEITLSAWVKASSLAAADNSGIVSKYRSQSGSLNQRSYALVVNEITDQFGFVISPDGTSPSAKGIHQVSTISVGVWYHVVATYSPSAYMRLYINGVLEVDDTTSVPASIADTAAPLWVGLQFSTLSDLYYFNGIIDDVRIYNRALTSNEVQSLYTGGQVTRKVVSNRGLVGHWSLDEGTSTVAHDFSGNSLHGTLTNMAPHTDWISGKKGKALDFDGTDDFIALGNPSALGIVGQVTVSAWVNFSSFPTASNGCVTYCGVIFEKGYDGSVEGYSLRYKYNAGAYTIDVLSYSGVTQNYTSWPITFPVNTWHHVVGLHNGTQWKLYVDGVNVATTNDNDGALSSTANASIGGAYISGTPSRFFPGKIDDVRVYNRALSDSEVSALYSQNQTAINSSQQNRLTDGLVGYWSFNGSDISWANNLAYDRSGRNNHARITSMSTTTSPVPGKSGQALSFDAVDDIVNAGSASSLDDLIPMSVSFWMKPNSAGEGSQSRVVAKNGNIGAAGVWMINFITGAPCMGGESNLTNAIYFIKSGSTATVRAGRCGASNSVTLGEWQHFVVTWDGSTGYNNSGSRIYRNGVEISYYTVVASGIDSAGSDASLDLVIGNRADTARTFDGAIDEVRVYNRVLSIDEAKQLYRLGR